MPETDASTISVFFPATSATSATFAAAAAAAAAELPFPLLNPVITANSPRCDVRSFSAFSISASSIGSLLDAPFLGGGGPFAALNVASIAAAVAEAVILFPARILAPLSASGSAPVAAVSGGAGSASSFSGAGSAFAAALSSFSLRCSAA